MANTKLNDESSLILYCSRLSINEPTQEKIKKLLSKNSINWDKIITIAGQHQAIPFLYYNLNKLNLQPLIPTDILAVMKNYYYSNLVKNSALEKEILLILTKTNQEKINIIPFRGFDLAHTLYNNLGLRIMADIDILIKECDFAMVKNILNELSYKYIEESNFESVFTKLVSSNLSVCVEIHPNLAPDRPYKINLPCLWERTQEKNIDEQKILYLSNEDTFIALALHLRRHTRRLTLKFITDIAELINNKLDFNYIKKAAEYNRINTLIYFALYAAKELLDAAMPLEISNQFKPGIIKTAVIGVLINKNNFFKPLKYRGIILRIIFFDYFQDFVIYLWKMATAIITAREKIKK